MRLPPLPNSGVCKNINFVGLARRGRRVATALNSLSQFTILSSHLITVCRPIVVIVTVFVINNIGGVADGAQSQGSALIPAKRTEEQKDRINICLDLPNLNFLLSTNDKGIWGFPTKISTLTRRLIMCKAGACGAKYTFLPKTLTFFQFFLFLLLV